MDEGGDCRNCGGAYSPGARFCVRCGTRRTAPRPSSGFAVAPSVVSSTHGPLQPDVPRIVCVPTSQENISQRRSSLNWAGAGLACIAAMVTGASWFFNSPEARPLPPMQPVAARAMSVPPHVLAATVAEVRAERESSVAVAPLHDSSADLAALASVKNLQATPVDAESRIPSGKTTIPVSKTSGPEPVKAGVSIVPALASALPAPVAVLTASRPAPASAPAPVVAVARLPSPRDACGEALSVGASMCMALRCRSAPFNSHAQCVEFTRTQKEQDQQRQQRQEAGG